MKKHSKINQILHKIYLKSYFISKSTLIYELDKYEENLKNIGIKKCVFITGLARSGTTILLREIHDTKKFSSLQYKNMPFLFLPNTYQLKYDKLPTERSHNDSIKINGDSPEEFDEYFWKVYLKDLYIKNDSLIKHKVNKEVLNDYCEYIKLVCISKNKPNYISKNNNNILRISSLVKIPNSVFFFLIRSPADHASSLMKLHKKFSKEHESNPFSLDYFNLLGHHEFGLNQKPFNLNTKDFNELKNYEKSSIDYWLLIWKQYYQYLLKIYDEKFHLIFFEDLINERKRVNHYLNEILQIKIKSQDENFSPPVYDKKLNKILNDCNKIFNKLKEKIKY